jgi:predicted lipase
MPFDPQFALNTVLPLAEAAYNVTTLPAPWKLIATIQPDNFGFVASSPDAIVIAFRGTQTGPEWLEDFDALPVANQFGKGTVHKGFQDQYAKVRASVLAALAQVNLRSRLWITGHSLGGALATLCASDAALAKCPKLTYTWAAPRSGWHDYADWFKTLPDPLFHIMNEWDIVPHEPPAADGYEHAGSEVLIAGPRPPFGDQFLKIAHNLELSYGPGVQKLITASLPKAA